MQLLVGQNYRQLQPWAHQSRTVGRLRLCDSLFGCGMVLTGFHPSIRSAELVLTNHASVHKAYVSLQPPRDLHSSDGSSSVFEPSYFDKPSPHHSQHSKEWQEVMARQSSQLPLPGSQTCVCCSATYRSKLPTFWEAEELGTAPEKHCLRCRSCQECSYRAQKISREEQEVVRQQEDRMEPDPVNKCVKLSYVWKSDVDKLKDNLTQVVPIQRNIEKRVIKSGNLDSYNKELNKAIEAGSVVRLSKEDINQYTGPVSYCTHFPVFKPGSTSTPLRIVFNGALKNRHCNLSPNDCMHKGPNALNSLLEVLMSWRSKEVALVLDLAKAYQSLHTGELERHVWRIIWRWGETDKEWDVLAYDRVTFGDLLAALALELAKKKGAEQGVVIDPAASEIILRNTYVDDTAGGGTKAEVDRYMGEELPDGSYTGTIPQIYALVGLKPKVMIRSGETDPVKLAKLGKVLGHNWDATEDVLTLVVPSVYWVQRTWTA